ncbi:FAD-binding oxidoreductase [Streptomyces spinoverrucosus]|uniref:FAD-binding oxidoreductase n=1 Tax=Streptomyces spinoverrucosus TaxID=284043 RepID=UPI0018C41672|nr:FAD-binding oxidoreductase [Streptomyces spinoverrucosus]MBG0853381.1 FAD-binding oxidoreductase [Streptomyces spinoverrucosus]
MSSPHAIPDLFALSDIHGPVLRPTDPGYTTELAGFNLAAPHTPDLVVGATGADDIVAAMRWAAATHTPVAVQATGHGANFPVDHGLLINTSRMTDVHVDARQRTATIAAGAKARHALDAAAPHGLTILTGTSTDVGVVGFTLGGGLPILGRAYGYASDLVRSFNVVTPDGIQRLAAPTEEPDLFWALRGGQGNVGVVTELVTDLVPLTRLLGGGIHCPGEQAEPLLRTWREWTTTVPDEMCSTYDILRLPPMPDTPEPDPLGGGFLARVAIAWPGDPDEGERLLAPLRTAAPVLLDTVADIPCTDMDHVYIEPQDPLPVRESCALLQALPPKALSAFLHACGPTARSDYPLRMVELRHLGAALSRPAHTEDAVCARDAAYFMETIGVPADPEAAGAVETATRALHTAMAPYGTGLTMVNVHGRPGDALDRARAWTPEIYDRLRHTKATYDPQNLLRFGHAVPPAA